MTQNINKSAGFAAGTLVHTEKGLMPIQEIKVGDMVLSMPEEGVGEKAYKRVLKTIKTPNQEIYRCTYWARDQYEEDEPHISYVLATADHPIWSKAEEQWRPARRIGTGHGVYVLNHEKPYYFLYANRICKTRDEQGKIYGFCYKVLREDGDMESYFDIVEDNIVIYANEYGEKFFPNKGLISNLSLEIQLSNVADGTSLLCEVYNLAVEDYHTYFVGEDGLWVHSADGG